MNQDNLDDFFKRKLSDRHYDVDQRHWEEAKAMLAQRPKKKRMIWLWWGGSIAAGIIVLLGIGMGSVLRDSRQSTAHSSEIATTVDKDYIERSEKSAELAVTADIADLSDAIGSSNESKGNNNMLAANAPKFRAATQHAVTGTSQQLAEVQSGNIDLTKSNIRASPIILQHPENDIAERYLSTDQSDSNMNPKAVEPTQKAITVSSELDYLYTIPIYTLLRDRQKKALPFGIIHQLTPIRSGFMPFTRLGIYGAVAGTKKQLLASSTGIAASYQFKPKWALSTSLGYRNSRLSFTEQETAFYDLTASGVAVRTADVLIRPDRMAYIESSLSLNYILNKFVISSGIRVDRVISAVGTRSMIELMQSGTPQLDPVIQPMIDMNQFDLGTDVFNKWQTNLTAEVAYSLTNNILISGGLNYRLTRMIADNKSPNTTFQLNSDSDMNAYFFGQLRLSYQF